MTTRAIRLPQQRIQRDIQMLVRSFPSEHIVVQRNSERPTSVDLYGQPAYSQTVIFSGEALFSDAGGNVTRYGLGQVEEEKPMVLFPGEHDIRPGDFFRRGDKLYQIDYAPDHWPGFTSATIHLYQQGTTPAQGPYAVDTTKAAPASPVPQEMPPPGTFTYPPGREP